VSDPRDFLWRIGRRNGRIIYYIECDMDPNDGIKMVGSMDTPELALGAVVGHNALLRARREGRV
jgi:hypothetical protein